MNTATIFIKTEPNVKEAAQKTAKELGFSLSSILNGFLRQFVKTKTITFSANPLDEVPNTQTRLLLQQSEEEARTGKTISFSSGEAALDYLAKEIEDEKQK
jgi:addiction module RelB/DinJ family antitoxin